MNAISSKEYNEIMLKSMEEINELDKKIHFTSKRIEDRLKMFNIQNDYNYKMFEKIKESNKDTSDLLIESINKDFDITGITAHPKTIGNINNIFNLTISKSNNYHFRDDIQASMDLNGGEKNVTDILKHDSIEDKELTFIESDNQGLTMTIEKTNKFGMFYASSIEFENFLKDSVDINNITFYREGIKVYSTGPIENIGKSLHPLEERVSFNKVEIDFHLKYKLDEKYIFNMKHIYFLDSLFDDKSFCLIHRKLENNIEMLKSQIIIKTHRVELQSTLEEFNIEVYADEEMNRQIMPNQRIADNYSDLYIKVPLYNEEQIQSIKTLKIFAKYR